MSRAAALLVVVALAGCAGGGEARPAAPTPAERDVRALVARMLELHPGLGPGTPARAALQERGDALAARAGSLTREELVAEVMRLTTLGERNGHTGVYVFHPHARPLHVYPRAPLRVPGRDVGRGRERPGSRREAGRGDRRCADGRDRGGGTPARPARQRPRHQPAPARGRRDRRGAEGPRAHRRRPSRVRVRRRCLGCAGACAGVGLRPRGASCTRCSGRASRSRCGCAGRRSRSG